ncbi:transposase-like protein [Jejuia pallidilutea]|jgi:transposase-like protein|uniref:Transposase-like protein n=1 Tax=Jejuia pallidilutea TaxID=504487 RepID=A0A362WXH5_9FLAO|nr:transposase [Jejuia pallidilutea]PQV45753.1 transposase-like protein [Jejuia pallidilutea]
MKTSVNNVTTKRTQKDYSLSFKLQLVEEVEQGFLTKSQAKLKYGIQGDSTVTKWLQKYGNFDWENQLPTTMSKTPEQRILELEARVKLLEKQKARAEHLAERADKKVIIFDMLVDMAEKEYDIQIRKNYKPELSNASKRNKERP